MIWVAVAAAVAVLALAFWLIRARSPGVSSPAPVRPSPSQLGSRLAALFGGPIDGDTWRSLEDALVAADVGAGVSADVVAAVRAGTIGNVDEARTAIATELRSRLLEGGRGLSLDGEPAVVVVVGVNGSGKTTSIAKLARMAASEGHRVMLAAADTFRAAASDQLRHWSERVGAEIVSGEPGADPASVAFDAVAAARARGCDTVIIDTAGRLHSETNLMDELSKVVRVVEREQPVSEVLLVIDGTGGQNGIAQARSFREAVPITGILVTKLDGTARGGVVVAIEEELGIPVKLIGVGEGPGDLLHFDPREYVDSLLEGP